MQPQSFFETFTVQDVSRWVDLFGIAVLVAGIVGGLTTGRQRKDLGRRLVIGLMIGALGPAIALSWHVVDARTSYWDYIYREMNPGQSRVLWPLVGAGKLDSVSNLLGLAAAFAAAGIAGGLLYARLFTWLKSPGRADTPDARDSGPDSETLPAEKTPASPIPLPPGARSSGEGNET